MIAHHYCELSDQALNQTDLANSKRYLKKALASDRNSVRASLLQGKIDMQQGRFKTAIKSYKRVKDQAPEFLSEAIQPLGICYQQLKAEDELIKYLQQVIIEYPRVSIILFLAERLHEQFDVETAINFVGEFLRNNPSLRGLNRLIEWHLENTYGVVQDQLQVLHDITTMLLENKPIYRCGNCGFSGKQLHWQCPGCKQWESVKPIHGIEGD